jgi:hypothetical protein
LVEAPDRIPARSACDSPLPHRDEDLHKRRQCRQARQEWFAGGKTGGADNLCAMVGGDSSRRQCPKRRRHRIVTRIRRGPIYQQACGYLTADCGQRASAQRTCGN